MKQATQRRVTIHIPDGHKPLKERCSGSMPDCSMNHYVSIPAITTRGTWKFEHIAHIPGKN